MRDLTSDGRLSTYNESVLKLSKVSFRGKYAHAWDTLYSYHHQQNSPGWVIFLQLAWRAALPARCSILYYIFSLVGAKEDKVRKSLVLSTKLSLLRPLTQLPAAKHHWVLTPPPSKRSEGR